jgi:hypothetical protein
MRRRIRKVLLVAFYGLLATTAVCFAVAMRFQMRKHDLSGVPVNHYVVSDGGQQFAVSRLGDSSGQRPRFPITPAQYERWEENQRWSALWGWLSGLCCFAAVASGLVAGWMSRAEVRARHA